MSATKAKGKTVAKRPPRRRAPAQRKKSGNPPGRPTRLTPATSFTICESLRMGNYREAAAASAGIGTSTFYEWLERARAAREAGKTTIYTEFADALALAEQQAEHRMVDKIRNSKDWRAQAWLLERTRPKRFGRREELDVTTGGEVRHTHTVEVSPVEEQQAEVARILAESGAYGDFTVQPGDVEDMPVNGNGAGPHE